MKPTEMVITKERLIAFIFRLLLLLIYVVIIIAENFEGGWWSSGGTATRTRAGERAKVREKVPKSLNFSFFFLHQLIQTSKMQTY